MTTLLVVAKERAKARDPCRTSVIDRLMMVITAALLLILLFLWFTAVIYNFQHFLRERWNERLADWLIDWLIDCEGAKSSSQWELVDGTHKIFLDFEAAHHCVLSPDEMAASHFLKTYGGSHFPSASFFCSVDGGSQRVHDWPATDGPRTESSQSTT